MNLFQLKDDAPKKLRYRFARLLSKIFFIFMVTFIDPELTYYKVYAGLLHIVGYNITGFDVQSFDKSIILQTAVQVQNEPVSISDGTFNELKKSKDIMELFIKNESSRRINQMTREIINDNER